MVSQLFFPDNSVVAAKLMPKIFTVEWKAIPSCGTGPVQFSIANAFDFPGLIFVNDLANRVELFWVFDKYCNIISVCNHFYLLLAVPHSQTRYAASHAVE
jgi:hypothetical protein